RHQQHKQHHACSNMMLDVPLPFTRALRGSTDCRKRSHVWASAKVLLLALLISPVTAAPEGWSRVCDQACTSYHGFQASLDDVKSQCAKDSECAAVVDFTGNGGLIALCRKDTEYRAWSKVCVEKKAGDEL
ncbi:unnamed protein product, partial [Polarella glacialis]